jgi:hypothetical protein
MRTSSFLVFFLVGISFLLLLVTPFAESRSIDVHDRQTHELLPAALATRSYVDRPFEETADDNASSSSSSYHPRLRRRLPGDYNFDATSAEAGFAAGLLLLILLALLLCCCCCGGGRGGCSLWDLVAMVCLWEMCCDRDGGDAFAMM